jgi:hypothetical protein
MIKTGTYLHYKNQQYRVLGIVQHSETLEYLVYYQALYGERGYWVRPLEMFTEIIIVNGIKVPRFKWVSE